MLVLGLRFGEEVREIVGSLEPFDDVVTLAYAVTDPVESHVDGFGAPKFDGVVSDADGTSIVAVDKCRRLRVTECARDSAEPLTDLGKDEKGCIFCFGNRSDHHIDDVAVRVYGAIDVSGAIAVTEESESTGNSSGAGTGQMRRVGLHVQDHVAGGEYEFVVGIGCGVREQAVSGVGGGLCCMGLVRGDGRCSREHGGVDCTGVVEEAADDLLEAKDAGGG